LRSGYRDLTEHPAVVVLVADPDPDAGRDEKTLQSVLGLSRAESRLACVLLEVGSLAAASRRLGVTHNTARSQLRSIFAKTHVHSQVELARVLCALDRLDAAS
jgi:DNA-binding CsgD family transcriptional regulator